MRVAVMSDIHGFDRALEAILDDIGRHEPLDAIVVAGDHCEVGPDPAAVIDILRAKSADPRWIVLQGNTDRDIVEAARDGYGRDGMGYVIDRIRANGVAFLAGLSFSHRITPPGGVSPDDDLLVVHANPFNLDDRLHPAATDDDLRDVLGDTRAQVVAFGHIHIAYVRQVDEILLVDVSAVGNPKDGDLRCAYGIIEWDETTRRWLATIHRIDYPLDETESQIMLSGLPNPEKTLKKLKKATY